jgi:hypothetical protein
MSMTREGSMTIEENGAGEITEAIEQLRAQLSAAQERGKNATLRFHVTEVGDHNTNRHRTTRPGPPVAEAPAGGARFAFRF